MAAGVYKAIHEYKVPRGIGELLHERSTIIIIFNLFIYLFIYLPIFRGMSGK